MGRPIIVLCVALVPILCVITTTQNDMAALFVTLYLHFGQIVRTLCGINVFFLPPDREEAQKSSSESAQPSPIT